MFRRLLKGSREPDELVARLRPREDQVGDGGLAFGDGAGLIQHDGVYMVGGLEGFRRFDEDAVFRADAGPDHNRSRGREAEGAGAGDDQHRDGGI